MNGDISRITFNALNHYTSVVLQQGRVQMDADGNEQTAILLHYLRGLAADLIGQHGGPDDLFDDPATKATMLSRNCGFGIIAAKKSGNNTAVFPSVGMLPSERAMLDARISNNRVPLVITGGHYYVDGLLCESEDSWPYSQQPYLERANDEELRKLNGVFLLYLDVWERLITSLEDPATRDVALGGADTAARTRLTWQVRVWPRDLPGPPPNTCATFNRIWSQQILPELQAKNRGRLSAKAKEGGPAADANPCTTSPEARYRGMENQLYRVEVHQGGPALDTTGSNQDEAATFKWSRDNATVVATLKRRDGDRLIVNGLRDFSRWFTPGNWVEITHDALELQGLPGTLVRLARVDGETLTIDPYTTSGTIYEPNTKFANLSMTNLKVRRWDQKQPEEGLLKEGALPIEEDEWIELEDGVVVKFEPGPPASQYRTGDYWLIPARVSTGDVEWPHTLELDNAGKMIRQPKSLPPHGVDHHYAPLAVATLDNGMPSAIVDLRHKFQPLGVC
ncbi:MAG: DUF6519 domain-containing protein [Acidobacteriota bacterium]